MSKFKKLQEIADDFQERSGWENMHYKQCTLRSFKGKLAAFKQDIKWYIDQSQELISGTERKIRETLDAAS